ncbi:MAG TPA: DUF2291 domain-containing protein [Pseudonocardia sp.]|nr:DUF2291 domain-containing protein [Pseudonocardia sp.]
MSNQRRLDIHSRLVVALVAFALIGTGCARVPGIYVYEAPGATAAPGSGPFDAAGYVDGIWATQVLPTVSEKAVDAGTLLPAIEADPAAAGAQYGRQAGTGSPFAYLISGTGTVTALDTAKPSGPLTVQVGERTVYIATGPVLAGTALRDAMGIDFSQFTNQLDYADVATQLNDRAKTDVIGKLDKATVVGKTIRFTGAFAQLGKAPPLIVPTSIEIAA